MPSAPSANATEAAKRAERLAAALRANLRRRKAAVAEPPAMKPNAPD